MDSKASLFIDSDWQGKKLSPPAQISLSTQKGGLLLQAAREDSCRPHPLSHPHEFFEGLWEFDVAEAFILEPESGRYLEVNLAPNGAWWACLHSGIRERETRQPSFEGTEALGKIEPNRWEASLFLPDSLFSSLEGLRINATFILNSPAQTFHSLAKLPGEQPDFHQPDHFLPLEAGVPS